MTTPSILQIHDLNVWIQHTHILNSISLQFSTHHINTIIGPSGSGKSTLLRSINRINDEVDGLTIEGDIIFDGENINSSTTDVTLLRKRIGMVFQKPCIFPTSIRKNVLFGIERHQKLSSHDADKMVEEKLKAVSLWSEVRHRLNDNAHSLSLGQQQRLCIARTLAIEPEIILLDEPTSSLDPIATLAIEQLMLTLKKDYTLILVTHNLAQAKRIADTIALFCEGKVVEQGTKAALFSRAQEHETRNYLNEEMCNC